MQVKPVPGVAVQPAVFQRPDVAVLSSVFTDPDSIISHRGDVNIAGDEMIVLDRDPVPAVTGLSCEYEVLQMNVWACDVDTISVQRREFEQPGKGLVVHPLTSESDGLAEIQSRTNGNTAGADVDYTTTRR